MLLTLLDVIVVLMTSFLDLTPHLLYYYIYYYIYSFYYYIYSMYYYITTRRLNS